MFKLSPEASLDGAITVENKFIVEYMPYADGDYVKVYLYGLSLAARKQDPDDSVERLSRRLNLDMVTVDAAIEYWTERGLMSRLGDEICFFGARSARPKIKKFDVDKYTEFNRLAQLHISERQISPNEFHEYYSLIEKLDLEWQAMALIIKYCVNLKGGNVSCQYILAVARNLAQDGYRTADDVGERLDEYGVYYNDLCSILGAMGGKRPDHESIGLYKKWKHDYKFDFDLIYHVACSIKRGGAATLDNKLAQYRELGFTTVDIIDKFEADRKELYKLAQAVNKAIGVYYESTDAEIAMYIKPWLSLGLDNKAILAAAEYCMKNDLNKLSDLENVIRTYVDKGMTTAESIYGDGKFDKDIEKIKQIMLVEGGITKDQRAKFEFWTEKLNMPTELIEYAATLATGKDKPFAYINKLLVSWHDKNITTVAEAKAAAPDYVSEGGGTNVVNEKYSADYLNSLSTPITEEDE